jgi:signal peptidase II
MARERASTRGGVRGIVRGPSDLAGGRMEMALLLAMCTLVFVLDRGAKSLAFRRVGGCGQSYLAGLVTVRPFRNRAPFGWPEGSSVAWVAAFATVAAASVASVSAGVIEGPVATIGLGAALGGALGNVFDRLRHGAVLDFLDLGIGSTFNTADVALLVGLACVFVPKISSAAERVSAAAALVGPGGPLQR